MPRSSRSRCCSWGWAWVRFRPSWGPSPSQHCPTNGRRRSAVCRTPSPTWALLGTALVGSVLIAALSSAALAGISGNSELEAPVQDQVTTEISSGVAFVSDAQLEDALADAGVDEASAEEIVQVNTDARLEALQAAFAVAAVLAALAFLFTGRLPTVAPGSGAAVLRPATERC